MEIKLNKEYEVNTLRFINLLSSYSKNIQSVELYINEYNQLFIGLNGSKYVFNDFPFIIKEIIEILNYNQFKINEIVLSNHIISYNKIFIFINYSNDNIKNTLNKIFE